MLTRSWFRNALDALKRVRHAMNGEFDRIVGASFQKRPLLATIQITEETINSPNTMRMSRADRGLRNID